MIQLKANEMVNGMLFALLLNKNEFGKTDISNTSNIIRELAVHLSKSDDAHKAKKAEYDERVTTEAEHIVSNLNKLRGYK